MPVPQEQPPSAADVADDPEAALAATQRRVARIADEAFWAAQTEALAGDERGRRKAPRGPACRAGLRPAGGAAQPGPPPLSLFEGLRRDWHLARGDVMNCTLCGYVCNNSSSSGGTLCVEVFCRVVSPCFTMEGHTTEG